MAFFIHPSLELRDLANHDLRRILLTHFCTVKEKLCFIFPSFCLHKSRKFSIFGNFAVPKKSTEKIRKIRKLQKYKIEHLKVNFNPLCTLYTYMKLASLAKNALNTLLLSKCS